MIINLLVKFNLYFIINCIEKTKNNEYSLILNWKCINVQKKATLKLQEYRYIIMIKINQSKKKKNEYH